LHLDKRWHKSHDRVLQLDIHICMYVFRYCMYTYVCM
jgi:hypothetical protein